jgi:hypothetical protein
MPSAGQNEAHLNGKTNVPNLHRLRLFLTPSFSSGSVVRMTGLSALDLPFSHVFQRATMKNRRLNALAGAILGITLG